jgi:hypothetical protein
MAENQYPFIRGKGHRTDYYVPPQGRGSKLQLPPRNPASHSVALLGQLDAIVASTSGRPPNLRDTEATRETIVVSPESGFALSPSSLGDSASDVRVIGIAEEGTVLLDAKSADLPHLRKKIGEFADDAKVTEKGARRNAPAIAPISEIRLSTEADLIGPRCRTEQLAPSAVRWFEVACRGGARHPEDSALSLRQVSRQSAKLATEMPQHFLATEQLVFFIRVSLGQLRTLIASVDCVQEFDLAPPDIRDWLLVNNQPVKQLRSFSLESPPPEAPAVVLLDTGIATGHPLLGRAILASSSVVPPVSSVEDTHGHGTQMAGVALYGDELGYAIERGSWNATHWLHSVRLLSAPRSGTANESQRVYWPKMTIDAVTGAETDDPNRERPRVFAIATSYGVDIVAPTYWSHAIDRLAYNDGIGRLFCIAVGNADVADTALIKGYPTLNLEKKVQEPAQSANAITVGAYTVKTTIPPEVIYSAATPVATTGGISPHTSAGVVAGGYGPDLVMEGGNVAFDGNLSDPMIESLTTLTTGHEFLRRPLAQICATSEATARASRLAASVWARDPELSPAAVRGLLVHSSSWTETMVTQFPNIDERLAICGLGVPNAELATACASDRATVVFEDRMPNAVLVEQTKPKPPKTDRGSLTELKLKRVVKFFRFPVPESVLLEDPDRVVELRVTLSYLPEPNMFRRHVSHGLDLKWYMQGPSEREETFIRRVNKLAQGKGNDEPKGKPFKWDLKISRRSRGTVQSDRWTGPASYLAGSKLIAVVPVLGWWDRRPALRTLSMPFTLVVTVVAAGLDVYNSVRVAVEGVVEID